VAGNGEPRSLIASYAPVAIRSVQQKRAVGRRGRSSSFDADSYPPTEVASACVMSAGSCAMPASRGPVDSQPVCPAPPACEPPG
jgi:hypothetical protein